jgi:hypothetical protein
VLALQHLEGPGREPGVGHRDLDRDLAGLIA